MSEKKDGDGEEGEALTAQADAITSSPNIFYFYQASDGQNIFMHPLNFRCIHKQQVSFDKLPRTVEGKIIQLEEVSQSDKMRYFPLNMHVAESDSVVGSY